MAYVMSQKRVAALNVVDCMPPALRGCVHEFGKPIVDACLQVGVRDPRHIRELVTVIWDGARQQGQKAANYAGRSGAVQSIDWILIQNGAPIGAETLLHVLKAHHHVVVPRDPTNVMVDASMEAIAGMGVLTKREKHRIRLTAAIRAVP